MRVLITGARGQLGRDLMEECKAQSIEAVGIDIAELDITDGEACREQSMENPLWMPSFIWLPIPLWIGLKRSGSCL